MPAAARWLREKRWKDEQVQPMVENLPPEGEKSLHPRFENFQSHGLNSNHSWAFKNIEVEEKPEEVVILTPNDYHKEILLSYLCDLERFFKKVVQVAIAPSPAGWLEIRS